MSLPQGIAERVNLEYPPDQRESAAAILSAYGKEPYQGEGERVMRCCLDLAGGNLAELEKYVGCALRDYRDVILWAEYPQEACLDTAAKRQAFNAMLERFGADWRVPEE